MEELELFSEFTKLSKRFFGISLEKRASGTGWSNPWRARIVSTKNERGEFRIECFGDTPEEAISNLLKSVEEIDASNRKLSSRNI